MLMIRTTTEVSYFHNYTDISKFSFHVHFCPTIIFMLLLIIEAKWVYPTDRHGKWFWLRKSFLKFSSSLVKGKSDTFSNSERGKGHRELKDTIFLFSKKKITQSNLCIGSRTVMHVHIHFSVTAISLLKKIPTPPSPISWAVICHLEINSFDCWVPFVTWERRLSRIHSISLWFKKIYVGPIRIPLLVKYKNTNSRYTSCRRSCVKCTM